MVVLLNACNPYQRTKKEYVIGFSQCCADPWREIMEREMYRELTFQEDLDFIYRQANNNNSTQIEDIKELMKLGIDLLIVAPNEMEPLTPIVEEVYDAGIPVILIDRKTQSEKYTSFIGADNYEIGQTAAHYLANRFNGQGNIIELQLPSDISPAIGRTEGFKNTLETYPDLRLLTSLEVPVLAELENILPPLLAQFPETDIIYAHTDLIAQSAHAIAAEAGLADSIFFAGIDGIPGEGQGIQAVEEGILGVSFLYPTGGEEAIQLAADILKYRPFQKENNLETIAIDENNVRIMRLQGERILKDQKDIERQQELVSELQKIYRNQRTAIFIILFSLILSIILIVVTWRSLRMVKSKKQKISDQKDRILQMSEQAKARSESMFSFFTNIAHEFKTPLTLIFSSVEDLLESGSKLDAENRKDAFLIRKNASRLLVLINQLMDFRKLESNKMRVQASEHDIIAFLQGIMHNYRKIAHNRNIDFQLLTNYDSFSLWFDANMMDKILFNLLSNAFKFTPDGGRIYVKVFQEPGASKLSISVEDSGPGMSQEQVSKIFDRFYQSQHSHKGTGIGLALSQELTQLHKGQIEVKSEAGEGTNFVLRFPIGKDHFQEEEILEYRQETFEHLDYPVFEMEEAQTATPMAIQKDRPIEQSTILLIDDNAELTEYIRKKLKGQYLFEEARDGVEGWKKIVELTPDLVVSDVLMPGMPGLELTQKVRSDIRTSHIPLILLTGRSGIEHQIEGIQSGADAYITKPFSIDLLNEKIKNLLISRQHLKEYYLKGSSPEKKEAVLNPLDEQFITQFTQIVSENYTDSNFGVNELCKELGFSRSQLYRKVKVLMGQTITDYIQQIRLEAARKLLLESGLSISEIAYEVGYNSPDYFSTAFKGRFGVSPSQFKENA
jgi:signal transduction histidine kinase/AraC-like DNA-binding protein